MHVEINHGHDQAELVREADPGTGVPVHHAINRTQLSHDRLLFDAQITRLQWQAVNDVTELWAAARPVSDVASADMTVSIGSRLGGGREPNPAAQIRFTAIVRNMRRSHWLVVERLVYDNWHPNEWPENLRKHALAQIREALDALAHELGLA